jgi:hypothetical protein
MTRIEAERVTAGLLDDALAAVHARHWPALARRLVLVDKAAPEELAEIEAHVLRVYVVWKVGVLRSLFPQTIH